MKTFERFAEIWQQYADKLPEQIGQRKFAYSINHSQKDVLLKKNSYDSYWLSSLPSALADGQESLVAIRL